MDIFKWLITLFAFLVPAIFLIYWLYTQKIRGEKQQLQSLLQIHKEQAQLISQKEQKLAQEQENFAVLQKNLQVEKEKNLNLAHQLFQKEQSLLNQLSQISHQEAQIKAIREQVISRLEEIIPLSREEARKILFSLLQKKVDQELEKYKEVKLKEVEEQVQAESTKIICLSLEKSSSELVVSKTTIALQLESREIIGKIIGREGRNINAFQKITGTELIIDQETDEPTVQVSSFNSLRREIAYQTLASLVKEEKISPVKIEKTYQKISSEIDQLIIKTGKEALKELELSGLENELIKYVGKLKYRTSYGQNVLEHCLEVASLAGNIAAELDLDAGLARRAGLLHDIGKAVEEKNISHVVSGVSLAKKYHEPAEVVNAIASHHGNFPADNFYSLIILAADRLSAARPGARGYQLEAYLERMNKLEKIAQQFSGIKKSYAFQAGREIWIMADAEKLNDYQTWEVARQIKEKIKKEIIIHGEVTIYTIREKRFVQKLHHYDKPKSLDLTKNKTYAK
ncbi:MAG: HDIG domain-containing protein [Candidatus Moeniiplasma glomeromycotorum]|nr:HDIG domain-containing protein [Candidatus Moeniiplasma glomeromycotorum]MCE8167223.1 HDIG domain-containing protein [Candidatus Moeniiplasma glomeromycotorum]MCE8168764.1 HDIG domain-containing protein [Candidatus Moeniiplasma glomeromycotorum]